jgi:hypothetical protein
MLSKLNATMENMLKGICCQDLLTDEKRSTASASRISHKTRRMKCWMENGESVDSEMVMHWRNELERAALELACKKLAVAEKGDVVEAEVYCVYLLAPRTRHLPRVPQMIEIPSSLSMRYETLYACGSILCLSELIALTVIASQCIFV